MQHLLLAVAILLLTIIAGNGRKETAVENNKVGMKIETPAVNNEEDDYPADKPSVFISRFDMFFY
ncbi:hypothetical protein A4H97_20480 [Niastella yeongjuensis]|uniref:Uncharacterized protein n=1 Tax=Niastella yeongjuensis TaxID=354355 RepID=A0A1V9FCR4_9BACT|nr:hypothetical protein [Niastella yeongjuensis]OQP55966.1 hypothetical protein A4H97_20480 [Niastella yeongjuensis]SEP26043.1 hypothetical protein SAMN05660816_04980 [Niastella yeongjuensis]